MNIKKERSNEIFNLCPMLYSGRKLPPTESLMCFGFECGEGWLDLLEDLSIELEMLNNRIYPKYRCYIRACQVKEKFGTLRYYYDVITETPLIYRFLSIPYKYLSKFIYNHVNFNLKYIDKPTNSKYHYIPTKHKFLYKIYMGIIKLEKLLNFEYIYLKLNDNTIKFAQKWLSMNADKLIREAEIQTESICENCGSNWKKLCITTGWISYLCEDCASKRDRYYMYKDDEKRLIWKNGVCLNKTMKQIREEAAKAREQENKQ